jgi:tetratricopeptide (TPR) repeat protein
MKNFLSFLLIIGLAKAAYPCGNEYGFALDGTRIYTEYFYLSERMLHFDTVNINRRLNELGKKIDAGNADYKTWSDVAVNLMKIGKADSSIKILLPLIDERPNEYNLIANLGTCYELTDKLDSALKYISKGLEINAGSHYGSEWIHVKILEAKIKQKNNARWMITNEIVNLKDLVSNLDSAAIRHKLHKINNDFFFQIRTRAPFTPAPNRTLGNLLITLGDFNAKHGTYENALLAYVYALEFQKTPDLSYRPSDLEKKIKNKIKTLNQQREAQEKIVELPEMFVKMMKRSKLDPELLLLGLDDIANTLDSINIVEYTAKDSLTMMQLRIDSLEAVVASSDTQNNNETLEETSVTPYLFLLVGLTIGISLSILIIIKKRRSKS